MGRVVDSRIETPDVGISLLQTEFEVGIQLSDVMEGSIRRGIYKWVQ